MKARTWWLLAGLVAVVPAGGDAWLRLGPQGRQADVAAGYVAHVVCSCRYVGCRDMASCATDFEPGMEIVPMSDDPAARRVTRLGPGPAEAQRTPCRAGVGCTFDD